MFAIFIILSCQLYAQSFEPGFWTTKESLEVSGVALPASSNEKCIAENQAKDAKASIEKELKKRGCVLTEWIVINQKLDAAIKCDNDDIQATGKLHGQFTRKNYDLEGHAEGTFKQTLPATAVLKLSGHWVKKCPKK